MTKQIQKALKTRRQIEMKHKWKLTVSQTSVIKQRSGQIKNYENNNIRKKSMKKANE